MSCSGFCFSSVLKGLGLTLASAVWASAGPTAGEPGAIVIAAAPAAIVAADWMNCRRFTYNRSSVISEDGIEARVLSSMMDTWRRSHRRPGAGTDRFSLLLREHLKQRVSSSF